MSNEDPGADDRATGLPRSPSLREEFLSSMGLGIGATFFALAVRGYVFHAQTLNSVFATLLWAVYATVVVWFACHLFELRRVRTFVLLIAYLLGWLIPCIFVMEGCALKVMSYYDEAPAAIEFAQNDFDQLDTLHVGTITTEQLHKITSDQDALAENLKALSASHYTIGQAKGPKIPIVAAQYDVLTVLENERLLLLPEAQRQRIRAAEKAICDAGVQLPTQGQSAGAGGCAATKQQLFEMQAHLDAEYPNYKWLLHFFGY